MAKRRTKSPTSCCAVIVFSNDEVERRAVAPVEGALSQSSTPLLGQPKTRPRDRSDRLLDAHYHAVSTLLEVTATRSIKRSHSTSKSGHHVFNNRSIPRHNQDRRVGVWGCHQIQVIQCFETLPRSTRRRSSTCRQGRIRQNKWIDAMALRNHS